MGKISSLLYGAALGAGLMYFMDPEHGNRRKAMIRDRAMQMRHNADDALDTGIRDLRLRARGILAEGMAIVSEEEVPDQVIEGRIRSKIGSLARHPGALEVSVQNKAAILSGDVLSSELEGMLAGVQKIRGVTRVENHLRVHESAGNIPQLQGEGWMPGDSRGNMQWSPSTRLLAGVGAGYMLLYGMIRGGLIGTIAKAGGVLLGARAFTNLNLKRITGMSSDADAIQIRKTININAPVAEVYDLWSNFENFPQFMTNIEDVKDMGDGRSHWVVKGPVGTKVEFDAMVTENRPNEVVAWKTLKDSAVKHTGQVRFKEAQQGTQVSVNMSYSPPAGVVGHTVASIFGKDPKSSMDQDLVRMKSLLEKGQTRTEGKTVTRDEISNREGGSGQREMEQNRQIPQTGEDLPMSDMHNTGLDMGTEMGMDSDIRPVDDEENDHPLLNV